MDKESALFYVVLLLFAVTGIVTILGLVQKVSIERKYLNALFSALVLELIAAVLYLFSNTNFFETGPADDELLVMRAELPPAHVDISGNELIALINAHDDDREKLLQLEPELISVRSMLDEQVPPYADVSFALDEKIREIKAMQARHSELQLELKDYQKQDKHFLVRMANLNTEISALGGTVNFDWEPDNKRKIAGMLQAALKQIGFLASDQQPDDDPARALRLLIEYQESKDFGKTGFLTGEVVAIIIRDYLAPVSRSQNAAGL